MSAQKKRDRKQVDADNPSPTTANDGPPPKKQRTDNKKPYKNTKSKHKKKGDMILFYQIKEFTDNQIENMLSNTTKGIDRPLCLFADNDMDCFFLRYVRNNGKNTQRQLFDDLHDINSKLLCKYDDYYHDEFLSLGIITNYVNKENAKNFNEFKANVDSNFNLLKNVITKLNIKHLIIPAKYPFPSKKTAISHNFNGPNLNHQHLKYIQSKLDEIEKTYSKRYVFTEYPVLYGDVEMNWKDLLNELDERRKDDQIRKKNIDDLKKHEAATDKKKAVQKEKKKKEEEHRKRAEDETEHKLQNVPDLPQEGDNEDVEDGVIMHSLTPRHRQRIQQQAQHGQHGHIHGPQCTHNHSLPPQRMLMDRVNQQQQMIVRQQTELRLAHQQLMNYELRNAILDGIRGNNVGAVWYLLRRNILHWLPLCLAVLVVSPLVYYLYQSEMKPGFKKILETENDGFWGLFDGYFNAFLYCMMILVIAMVLRWWRRQNMRVQNGYNVGYDGYGGYNGRRMKSELKRKCVKLIVLMVCCAVIGYFLLDSLNLSIGHMIDDFDGDTATSDYEGERVNVTLSEGVGNMTMNGNMTMSEDIKGYFGGNLIQQYMLDFVLWFFLVAAVSGIISNGSGNRLQTFCWFTFGALCMYIAMFLVSMSLSKYYGKDIYNMSHQERLDILWWFVYYILFPIGLIAVFISPVMRWANSAGFSDVINWRLFWKVILVIMCGYTMIYYTILTFYAIVTFGFLYMVFQCLLVSRENWIGRNVGNLRNKPSINGMEEERGGYFGGSGRAYNPYSAEWEIQRQDSRYIGNGMVRSYRGI